MSYASETSVPVDRSQREIEQLVLKAGATSFYRGQDGAKALIGFQLKERRIMFDLPLPQPDEFAFYERRGRKVKSAPHQVEQMLEQAERAKWRALALCIKAKLVSVESGVESFEEAFLAQVVVPHDGRAVRFGALAMKAIAASYSTGKPMPPLLPSGDEP